jgi:cell division protein FtsA
MNTANIVVGLDIRTTKIAAIVGRRSEYGKIEILGYGRTESIGVKRGIVSNIELTVDSIKRAIQEAEAKSEVDIKYVNVGIAGQLIKSLLHRGGLVRKNIEVEISQVLTPLQGLFSQVEFCWERRLCPSPENRYCKLQNLHL